MTTHAVDRCASCRTTIDLDWSAVACPCGAVVTCGGCDPADVCDECFDPCSHEWLDRPESDTRECLICGDER